MFWVILFFKSKWCLFHEFLFPFGNWEWVVIQLVQKSLKRILHGYCSSPKDYIRRKQKETVRLMADFFFFAHSVRKQKCCFSHIVLSYSRQIHEQFPLCFPAPHRQHEGPSQPCPRWELPFWYKLKVNILQHFSCCPNKKINSSLLSQPFPADFINRGVQDGGPSHPVCSEFHRGVCWMSGTGKSWQHPAVHALYNGEWWAGRRRARWR